ncbi:MAG: MotA/TolQ/ExbB proton channel family protein [Elainellaceae cyanobacterium]
MEPVIALFSAGGIVMIPLLLLSLASITLILERLLFWIKIARRQPAIVREVLQTFQTRPSDAQALLAQNVDLPIARILLTPLELPRNLAARLSPAGFRLALESATQRELPLLRRFNTVFDIVISVSPLLGLLGTVLGLIQSFSSLQISNPTASNATGIAAGISEALVSTVMGMAIAIVTLIFANVFRGLYRRQLALIQQYGSQLELLYLCRFQSKSVGAPR